jgi:hypothetical protein
LLVKIKAVIFTDEICHKIEINQMKTFDPIDEIYSTNELSSMYIIIFVDGVINMHAITNMLFNNMDENNLVNDYDHMDERFHMDAFENTTAVCDMDEV